MNVNDYYPSNNNSNNLQPPVGQPKGNRGVAIASLILGILAIPLGFCGGFFGILLGTIALILGIFSKEKNYPRPTLGIAGIITGALGISIGFIIIASSVYLYLHDPSYRAQYSSVMDFYSK